MACNHVKKCYLYSSRREIMIDQILHFAVDVAGITALAGITLFVAIPSIIDAVKKSL